MKRQQSMHAHQLGKFARLRDACRRQQNNVALGAKSVVSRQFWWTFHSLGWRESRRNGDRSWRRFHMDQQYVGSAVDDLIAKRTASHV
jgi:hypothetical protein